MTQVELPYAGTSGWRGSDASRDRAYREDESGLTGKRQYEVLLILASLGEKGATFTELSHIGGWSTHKTASVLSVLHKAERLARLKERRNRSSIYVDLRYVNGRESVPHGGKKTHDELLKKLYNLINSVLKIHEPLGVMCRECNQAYPCQTVLLLGDHA
jgi:hypothetical protein